MPYILDIIYIYILYVCMHVCMYRICLVYITCLIYLISHTHTHTRTHTHTHIFILWWTRRSIKSQIRWRPPRQNASNLVHVIIQEQRINDIYIRIYIRIYIYIYISYMYIHIRIWIYIYVYIYIYMRRNTSNLVHVIIQEQRIYDVYTYIQIYIYIHIYRYIYK